MTWFETSSFSEMTTLFIFVFSIVLAQVSVRADLEASVRRSAQADYGNLCNYSFTASTSGTCETYPFEGLCGLYQGGQKVYIYGGTTLDVLESFIVYQAQVAERIKTLSTALNRT